MSKKMKVFQHGDVIIKQASDGMIQHLKDRGLDRLHQKTDGILAGGETTGHAHRVEGDVELYEMGEKILMRVLSGNARVVHEEHTLQEIPPGDYEVDIVQEYDPFKEEARRVAD